MSADLFHKLTALGLTMEQVGGVLDIIDAREAGMKAAEEARKTVARERVQRWREKNKPPVTLQKHNGNATVPLTSADDAPATEENKQTNKQENKKERATRLPTDWQTPDEWIDEAVASGLSRAEALTEANRMKNWSISTKGAVKLDWHATWRNWFLRFLETRNSKRATGPPKKLTQGESLRNMARERGIIDDTGNPIGRLEASDGDREASSSGHVVRFAVAGNHGW